MYELTYNAFDLEEKDVDIEVIRTKALMINSKNEILLGYSYGTYQFPGGHLKEKETINDCLQREIEEETGIFISGKLNPFFKRIEYHKNYLNSHKNCKTIIYYYLIYTDEQPQKEASHLDSMEKKGNFTLVYVSLDKVDSLIKNSISDNQINSIVAQEMLDVLQYYREYM